MQKALLLTICMAFAGFLNAQSQNNFWQDVSESSISHLERANQEINIQQERDVRLDAETMRTTLLQAPMEFTAAARTHPLSVSLPLPDGSNEIFNLVESPIMEEGLAIKFPTLKTYSGRSAENPSTTTRIVFSVKGFHAIIHSAKGSSLIVPLAEGQQEFYTTFYNKNCLIDAESMQGMASCKVGENEEHDNVLYTQSSIPEDHSHVTNRDGEAVELRTYRIAVATTGEWYISHGNSLSSVLASVAEVVSDVNSIFEVDAAVRYILIADNDLLLFDNPQTDNYTNGDTEAMIGQNGPNLNARLGANAASFYDIGHVFGTNAGGLAALGSTCNANKANGVSCTFGAFSGVLFFHIPAHEIGHQMTATHTFNWCGDNETASTAYEPGSGSTIMSYAGAGCEAWLQPTDDEYFHHSSALLIKNFAVDGPGNSCAQVIATNNTTPDIELSYEDGFYIPIDTPFELTCTATDAENDALSYCWEQHDLGPLAPIGNVTLNAPLFRSFLPTDVPNRVFPRMDKIVNNNLDNQEILPSYARDLTFYIMVRDNNPEGGGVSYGEVAFKSDNNAGPFLVTAPNTGGATWIVNEYTEVTWDVANTTNFLVNCQSVNIKLSTDGGYTYPITLAENVSNDGSEFILVPNNISNSARVRVEAADNIFFDISNQNFSIEAATTAGFSAGISPNNQQVCLPDNAMIELVTSSTMGFSDAITFSVVSGLPAGATSNFTTNGVSPSEGTTLEIDMSTVTTEGDFTVEVLAEATGADPITLTTSFTTVSNDFSSFELLSPPNGTSGIVGSTEFEWTDVTDAEEYDIQIASSPSFDDDSMIAEGYGLNTNTFNLSTLLDENILVYWRVRPTNECGAADFFGPFAFHTVAALCAADESTDVPVFVPVSNNSEVESSLTINTSGTISDMNIPLIDFSFSPINSINLTLISPAGTEVVLYSGDCFNTNKIYCGFDDDAPNTVSCPPINGAIFQPEGSLAVFNGEESQGTWLLRVNVTSSGFNGGDLIDWGVEFCSSLTTADPYIVNNDLFPVNPGDTRTLTKPFLLTQDDDNTPNDLRYTIVEPTQHGTVYLDNQPLAAGGQFTQGALNDYRISYEHNGDGAATDYFTFTVSDGDGGWLGIPAFNINLDENAVYTTTKNVFSEDQIKLYPNPTNEQLSLQLLGTGLGESTLSILNIQGQTMYKEQFRNLFNAQLNTTDLASGIYFVQIQTASGIYAKKFVVQK